MALQERHTEDLRRGRVSMPGAHYFITCCAQWPTGALSRRDVAASLLKSMHALGSVLCATVMPDHVHALITLGERLTIGQCVGKFKTITRSSMLDAGLNWQRDFYEHRLRPEDSLNAYARYIFMNPHRANLIGRRDVWPWWYRGADVDFDFLPMLEEGRYPPEVWLEEVDVVEVEVVGRD